MNKWVDFHLEDGSPLIEPHHGKSSFCHVKITDRSKAIYLLWFSVACFWCWFR